MLDIDNLWNVDQHSAYESIIFVLFVKIDENVYFTTIYFLFCVSWASMQWPWFFFLDFRQNI